MNWDVTLVPSSKNKADVIMRVPKKWLIQRKTTKAAAIQNQPGGFESTKQIHDLHHYGVEIILYFAREAHLNDTGKGVEHTCQLSRFRRETPDFEDFSRSPDLNKKSPDITI